MNRISDISSRIFVGGLDNNVDEMDLEKAFKIFGDVTNVMVMRDKENGRSRGFAFVSFTDAHSSEEAISRMHGVEIRNRCVSVRHAEKAKFLSDDRPKRGGFRGGRIGHNNGSRSDSFRSGSSFRGYGNRGRGGFMRPSDRVYVTDDREEKFKRRSRSPISDSQRIYQRNDSPPRRTERFSPPPPMQSQRKDYYQPYGQVSAINSEDDYYSRRPDIRQVSPTHKEAMSPARERNAYIHARGLDYSPPPARPARHLSPDVIQRRSPSPRQDQYRREVQQKKYNSSSLKNLESEQRVGGRSQYEPSRMKPTARPPTEDSFRGRGSSPKSERYRQVSSLREERGADTSNMRHTDRDRRSPSPQKYRDRIAASPESVRVPNSDRRDSVRRGRSPPGAAYQVTSSTVQRKSDSRYEERSPPRGLSQRDRSSQRQRSPQKKSPTRYRSPPRRKSPQRRSPPRERSPRRERTPETRRPIPNRNTYGVDRNQKTSYRGDFADKRSSFTDRRPARDDKESEHPRYDRNQSPLPRRRSPVASRRY